MEKHWIAYNVLLVTTVIFNNIRRSFASPPDIQKFSFQDNIIEGKVVSVMCLAVSDTKPIHFTWDKNGKIVESGSKNIRIENTNEYSVLILDGVDSESEGNFTCTVSNSAGRTRHSAYLTVKVSPKWTIIPEDATIAIGQPLSVKCAASGSPPPEISWRKFSIDKNKWEMMSINSGIQKDRISELHFPSVVYDDAGFYQCTAVNTVHPNIASNFSIIIQVPARFEEKFAVVNAKKGDSARLKCEALGDQPLAVAWQRDQHAIAKGSDDRYEIFETLSSGGMGVTSELIIRTTDRTDGALYSCTAENEFGSDQRNIRLLVMEVPGPPLDVKVREMWSRSASVTWAPPYSGNSPITQYIVQYWRDVGGAAHRLQEVAAPSSQSSALLQELHPGASYVLKVVAENAVGRGEPSDPASFKTGEEEPSSPPADINAEPRGSSTIRVSWKAPPRDTWNGDIRGYYIGYRSRDSTQPYSYKTQDYASRESTAPQEFFLTNLPKAADYSVVVKAYNAAGAGPPSHELFVRTLDGDLPPAPSLYVIATSSTSVSLRWSTRKIDSPLSGYTVHYREETGQWQEVAVVAPEDNTYALSNLLPQRLYQIYVTATNPYGKGDPSEIVAVKTDEGGHSMLSVSNMGNYSNYLDMAIVIPVTASLLTIGVVLLVACVCVRKIRSRQNLERALAAEKHLAMVGTLQRYVEIDKTRSLIDPNRAGEFPLPYETIQMLADANPEIRKGARELRAFFGGKDGTQTLYNKPMTLRRTSDANDHIYDSAQ